MSIHRRVLIASGVVAALLIPTPVPALASGSSGACGRPVASGTVTRTLISGGIERSYRLHIPESYRPHRRTPLILAFHGRTRTGEYQEQLTGMSALPAILAYPQGTIGTDGQPSWQGAPYSSGVDDVAFAAALIDRIEADLCVDPARVYVSGKSNGGGFAALLACRLSDRIAAAAPVSGAFYPQGGDCDPVRGVPTIDFHGGKDTTIPYAGDVAKGLPSLPDWLAAWSVRNTCRREPATSVPVAGVQREVWTGCGADLVHYRVDDLGHTWPSTTPNNDSATPTVIDATPLIWDFFRAHPLPDAPYARTAAGTVRGGRDGRVDEFLGIPYAAPPVGALRWQAPQPVARWRGVRDAVTTGPNCPQGTIGREDCLYLNVYRPGGTKAGARLPVFVWIHGGGFTGGSGDDDAGALARAGAVVVTINYRLGALGFLSDPALGARPGNYGLMDQQAALRWVRQSISGFGGDPSRVTLGGESAGGGSVCAQLVSPGSAGLFRRAVIESDDCVHDVDSAAAGAQRSAAIATAVGCAPAGRAACLRKVPVAQLVSVTGYIAPVVDGRLLPAVPKRAIEAGRWHRMPVLIGSNREEGRAFATFAAGWTPAQYAAWLADGPAWPPAPGTVTFGSAKAAEILAAYPLDRYSGAFAPAYAIGAVLTDSGTRGLGGCTQLDLNGALARQGRTYAYRFEDPSPPRMSATPAGYDYGAAHAYELPYLFPKMSDGLGVPFSLQMNPDQRALSDRMVRAWVSFAAGHEPWPALGSGGRMAALRPGGPATVPGRTVAAEHHCALWDSILGDGPTP